MRKLMLAFAILIVTAVSAASQTADEIISKYIKTVGGMDEVEGTDTYKLKVTLANGETRYFYMDTDYYVPIKIETKRIVRGNEIEFETVLGDYKEVAGWYMPYSIEVGAKGSQFKQKIAYDKIEANVPVDDSRFAMPKKP